MNCTDAFPYILKKKIDKTGEARSGNGIYKRRNSRSYRVIMQLSTYKRIMGTAPTFLNNFKRGYAVRIKPNEYFSENGQVATDFPKTLTLGRNAFVYFKTIPDWDKFGHFCKTTSRKDWDEVVELYTKSSTVPNDEQWAGQYCLFIPNTTPKRISHICGTANNSEYLESLRNKYGLRTIPEQTGLGNFDYDYASESEIKKIKYQLSYMIFKVSGMKDYLINVFNSTSKEDLAIGIQRAINTGKVLEYIDKVFGHVEKYCQENALLNFESLSEIRAWDKESGQPICPLCLKGLTPDKFFEVSAQDEGREEEDNTQAEIVLMHIRGLRPGELNHHTYNLGWGHKHCNTIQGAYDIKDTILLLRDIITNQ
ncbi:BstXI family restriction endonuclease [Patescibacteria group bacterium]|nr:BstXI family restriction endonuclease [Patescibacteria group bacterium]MBU1952840.1 BstXI family restriction endonuclease [Patescibacteria group bacterium]